MKSKLLFLLGVAALGVAAIWFVTKGSGAGPEEASADPSAGAAILSSDNGDADAANLVDLEAPLDAADSSRELLPEGARAVSAEAPALAAWDVEDTLWVESSILLPEGTPNDEEVFVFASSRPFTQTEASGRKGPVIALREGGDPRQEEDVLAGAAVGQDLSLIHI